MFWKILLENRQGLEQLNESLEELFTLQEITQGLRKSVVDFTA